MIPVLPAAISTAVTFPDAASQLDAPAIFQLGRLAASYENRAWAREKVRQARTILSQAIEHELRGNDTSASTIARDQVKDREQVLMSLERFYKKQRHQTHDNFPQALVVMEQMIPGSTNGLANAAAKKVDTTVKPVVLSTSIGPT